MRSSHTNHRQSGVTSVLTHMGITSHLKGNISPTVQTEQAALGFPWLSEGYTKTGRMPLDGWNYPFTHPGENPFFHTATTIQKITKWYKDTPSTKVTTTETKGRLPDIVFCCSKRPTWERNRKCNIKKHSRLFPWKPKKQ